MLVAGSVNAVQTFIAGAKARGYTLVSIYECMWGPNFQRHPSWVYAHRNCGSPKPAWPAATGAEPCPLSDWYVHGLLSDWREQGEMFGL
jgi:hypothetical protein